MPLVVKNTGPQNKELRTRLTIVGNTVGMSQVNTSMYMSPVNVNPLMFKIQSVCDM